MNKDLDLTKILKDVPEGTKLWSPICGDCEFKRIDCGTNFPIACSDGRCEWGFRVDGTFTKNAGAECLLFPSRTNRDWSKFEAPKKHKEFKPFEKVLFKKHVGYCRKSIWMAAEYSHYDEELKEHFCTNGYGVNDDEILPYAGNEKLLGTVTHYGDL